MFLGMQDIDFCPNRIKIYLDFTKFTQIYSNFTQVCTNFAQILPKFAKKS